MTNERREQVNRLLAGFHFGMPWEAMVRTASVGGFGNEMEFQSEKPQPPNYTADLDALARLERKLPPHRWVILPAVDERICADLTDPEDELDVWGTGIEPTEAESRAECIAQYLESRKSGVNWSWTNDDLL